VMTATRPGTMAGWLDMLALSRDKNGGAQI